MMQKEEEAREPVHRSPTCIALIIGMESMNMIIKKYTNPTERNPKPIKQNISQYRECKIVMLKLHVCRASFAELFSQTYNIKPKLSNMCTTRVTVDPELKNIKIEGKQIW
jgi:hypothetical protein